jgi:CheY-like chemotaxis protein
MSAHALRILIVDDEPELAEGLAEMLALLGYPVEIAGDEQDALDRARAHAFDRLRRFPHAHDARQRSVLRD